MAIELPTRKISVEASVRRTIAAPGLRFPLSSSYELAEPRPWPRYAVRALEIFPGAAALLLITSLVWGYVWFPHQLALALLIFDVYWLWKSWTIGYHVVKGARIMKRFQAKDWRQEYEQTVMRGLPFQNTLPWEDVRHVVIIPNYKESESKLRQTLSAMAATQGARENVIPILAMEEAEPGAALKAAALLDEFAGAFNDLLVTYHPYGLPGEVRGKSSNEAWAAKEAVEELCERRGLDINHLTVTSCDADTVFPPQYFECLTYHFATDARRYRRFWQAPIFFYNNIWQVPAPLRVPNAIAGLVHLCRLSRKRKVLFSQSSYSLSMRMAHDVGYWDTDIIPEDWHMFLKCFYNLGGNVEVVPIHLPLGNDGALSHTVKGTYVNHYLQVRRWGWGASDIPFAAQEAAQHGEISLRRRMLRFWYLVDNHLSWSTQWFFITLGGFVPWIYYKFTGVMLVPAWIGLDNITGVSAIPNWITLGSVILAPCIVPFVTLIVLDARMRPAPPTPRTLANRILSNACWLAISPITFFCSALPALDAQVRLMLGRRMEYRVTEKV
jgi:hypothetical protein